MNDRVYRDEPVYLADLVAAVIQKWLFVLVIAACFCVSALVYVVIAKPIYEAEVLFAPSQQSGGAASALAGMGGQLDIFATLLGSNIMGSPATAEAVATLGSRALSVDFIAENGLLPMFFQSEWDSDTQAWKSDISKDRVPTIADAFRFFDKNVRRVDTDVGDGLMSLSIRWSDPVQAAEWANGIVTKANLRLRESAINEAAQSIEYLKNELGKTDVVEVRRAIYSVMEQQMQQIMLANVQEQFAFKVIDPAVAPEPDQFVAPRRLLIVVVATVLGGGLAVLYVLLNTRPRRNSV